ncbi:MAG: hypothetical protein JWP31_1215 [Aeromicrobium sp.]|nr:hypothetical protein [Aeromicrobium sp.]
MQTWEIEARLGVQKALADYTRCVDSGRLHELAELFTEACHYDMSTGVPSTSRAEIVRHGEQMREMFRTDPGFDGRVRHHTTSVSIVLDGHDEARATSYFMAMGRHGPDHWGVYRDVLVRVGEAWLFSRRVVTVEGHAPDSPAASTR